MGKREREVTDSEEIRKILDKGLIIHLGLSDDGLPYVIPMNYGYVYQEGKLTIYVHGARDGYKYEVLAKNPQVAFSIETGIQPFEGRTACQYGMAYESVLGHGTAELVTNPQEKMHAMTILMKTQTGREFLFDEKLVSIVNVIRIDVSEFIAKRRPLPGEQEK